MRAERVLITGGAGVVGTILGRDLRRDHAVHCLDLVPPAAEAADTHAIGSVAELDAIEAALDRVSAVVHLGANADPDAEWDAILAANIVGTRNVFEAARRRGLRRVVFASSNHVSRIDTIQGRLASADRPPAPINLYGVSKAFGETLARQYSFTHGLSVICLRIGWITPQDDPSRLPSDVDATTAAMWISHRDLIQAVRRALATDLAYGVFYAMSSAAASRWDLADAAARLGYQPAD